MLLQDRAGLGVNQLENIALEFVEDGNAQSGLEGMNSTFRANVPRVVLEDHMPSPSGFRNYDVAPDGRVIAAVNREERATEPTRTLLVLNWFQELRERSR